ncbi:unnamed protein product [Didymodactylos carnosus]|uniref:acid phosphatase n=1 Tax=Didymodactylos carnosus TaxID=1234261 RepID=A0A813S674_9BILA|nr:unnamed protein product [Didymodactylos carnosus]CAF0791841.1 unnamed protein product [Didymodactylos carnosus]CAF3492681.1 unnamed protein product [Didymodactylos carnosus]CAF3576056.1 unnamed protein product [Didymodactylos carnosus]
MFTEVWHPRKYCDPKLIAGHVIFRHGDRTPITNYPKDVVNESFWPNGYGQLTSTGIKQQRNLGRYIRQRYNSILNSTYEAKQITVRSTDYDRTLMSAYSNLLGLYPQLDNSTDISVQPIPVHTVPQNEDYLLGINICPREDQIINEIKNSDEVKNLNIKFAGFFKDLEGYTGFKEIDLFNAWDVADTIFVETLYNVTVPWATKAVQANLSEINDYSFQLSFSRPDSKRIRGGPIIKDILDNIHNLSASTFRNVKLYSAHDTTVSAVLSFLGINYPHQPPYASAVFIDFYQKDDQSYAIKVEYLNETGKLPYPKQLDNCPDYYCPFETFKSIYQPKLPGTVDVECAAKVPAPSTGFGPNGKSLLARSGDLGTLVSRQIPPAETKRNGRMNEI